MQSARCNRAALLIDGETYFTAFMRTAERARHSIIILAWDFDTRMCLAPHDCPENVPTRLGDFLNFLARRRRGLNIHILDWDYPMIFGTDREFPPLRGFGWTPHRRIHLRYDNTHPVGGSHHQKIVVIDDAVAFSGGLDLTSRRWDTCEHKADDPRRNANGTPYPPFHDLMAMVDGDAAKVLAAVARERWKEATGETLRPVTTRADPWPQDVKPELTNVIVGISRTMPALENRPEIREIEALYLDAISAAKRYIYLENQYFTAHKISEALAARLAEREGPEVVLVLRLLSHGWLEEYTMHALRIRLIKQLRAADRWNRLGVYFPSVEGLKEGTCVDVHSKAMIVDDEWLRIGSANICNRSMGLDSECDLTFEAQARTEMNAAIRTFRNSLLGEHLHVSAERVNEAYERTGSLNQAITALRHGEHTLKPLIDPPDVPDIVVDIASIADMERPVSMDKLVGEFAPLQLTQASGPAWRVLITVALAIVGLMAIWRFTPLADAITPEYIGDLARTVNNLWWAPLVVLIAYTPACIVMFPRPLITLFAVIAFGPWLGAFYGLSGVLIAALVTYFAGRMMKKAVVYRLAGSRLNHVTEILRKRGLMAVTALRIVPVAPFSIINLVAGAIRIKLWHFMLGSVIGLLPGTIATIVFGAQLETALRDPSKVNYWLVAGVAALFAVGIWLVRRVVFGGAFSRPATAGPV